jgi:hypothetical protein
MKPSADSFEKSEDEQITGPGSASAISGQAEHSMPASICDLTREGFASNLAEDVAPH